jgi:predicted nucleic acid-binding protein
VQYGLTAYHTLTTLDNSVVSSLHEAGALARVLGLWPGRWVLPDEVRFEAAAWPARGSAVVVTLDQLRDTGIIQYGILDIVTEGRLYRQLLRVLGRGEASAITIASHRGFTTVLDDHRARSECDALQPPVHWTGTEGLLSDALREGLLTRDEAERIWAATGIADPARRVR